MPKLPLVGDVKPVYVYTGGAVVIGVVGYSWWKRRNTAPAAAATSTGTDATIDPNTGMPYADETGTYGSSYGGIDPATGVPFIYESGTQSTTGASQYTTNQQWADAAIGELENTFSYTEDLATRSVRDYLSQKSLPPDEYQAMQLITAELGQPPTGTFNLKQAPTPKPPGTTTPASGTPKVGASFSAPWLVKTGQTQASVAARFGINPSQISGTFAVGHTVMIPWLIQSGQTLQYIAGKYGLSTNDMAQYVPMN
jgi:LysM repeat protein